MTNENVTKVELRSIHLNTVEAIPVEVSEPLRTTLQGETIFVRNDLNYDPEGAVKPEVQPLLVALTEDNWAQLDSLFSKHKERGMLPIIGWLHVIAACWVYFFNK